MKILNKHEQKILDDIATRITGIKPIEDREYQKLTYEKTTTKDSSNTYIQKWNGYFKSIRKQL